MPMKNLCMKNSEVVEQTAEVAVIPDFSGCIPGTAFKERDRKDPTR